MGKVVTLGEILLRLSTAVGEKIENAASFALHYGGGEANVAISLRNFGHDVIFASKLPESRLGRAAEQHLQRYGVDTRFIHYGGSRLGIYYMETGIGERPTSVIYDRTGSSFAGMDQNEWQLAELFSDRDIFHISGITPALSSFWQAFTLYLIKQARSFGCKISFDVNYREKLWTQTAAGEMLLAVLPFVDYCSIGALDAKHLLHISPPDDQEENELNFYYKHIWKRFPNLEVLYSTKRQVLSASHNKLIGSLWRNQKYYESKEHDITPIVDRVGGGDAFSAGVLHGILSNQKEQDIIDFATAASALKHTIHGDCNQFNESEVKQFLTANSSKIIR